MFVYRYFAMCYISTIRPRFSTIETVTIETVINTEKVTAVNYTTVRTVERKTTTTTTREGLGTRVSVTVANTETIVTIIADTRQKSP